MNTRVYTLRGLLPPYDTFSAIAQLNRHPLIALFFFLSSQAKDVSFKRPFVSEAIKDDGSLATDPGLKVKHRRRTRNRHLNGASEYGETRKREHLRRAPVVSRMAYTHTHSQAVEDVSF